MKQSMVSPLTGQLPNKPFRLGGFASENKVCCLQNHHFLGWKTKKYGDLFCVWWLVIPMSSVVKIWWQKWPSRQKERITLKNVPPPKKKEKCPYVFCSWVPRHGAIMKAPIKTWQSGQRFQEGRKIKFPMGDWEILVSHIKGIEATNLGSFCLKNDFNDWAPKNRAFFMGTRWFSL